MTIRRLLHSMLRTLPMLVAATSAAMAQATPAVPWREEAAAVGTSTRVLIIGAHPDDEDNALIAWLSLGRHIETAYLSITRGENGVNVLARERGSLLGMVRTAEALEERKIDGAHLYFTRAYDFGHAKNDSVLNAAWPRDSLIKDVVTVLRAFRPQVVISLFAGDSSDRDGQHRIAGELARQGWSLAGDTTRLPASRTYRLGAWKIDALYQLVDSADGPSIVRLNVGELDRDRMRSYAELGTEIRAHQRTQIPIAEPSIGATYRYFRRDSVGSGETIKASLFVGGDTGWSRFASVPLAGVVRSAVDSMTASLSVLSQRTSAGDDQSVIGPLSEIVRLASRSRASLGCADVAATSCKDAVGDLAVSLATTRDRATRALLDASGIVIDATAEREAVAAGDSVPVTITVHNGGRNPIGVTRVGIVGLTSNVRSVGAIGTIVPDSTGRWSDILRMRGVTYPWWTTGGLAGDLQLYVVRGGPPTPVITSGEDRYQTSGVDLTFLIGEDTINTHVGPIVARGTNMLRGDERHPVAGVNGRGILLERGNEYARASVPFARLERVYLASALGHEDTLDVTIHLPDGLIADSATRTVVVPPYGGRNVFFRVHGSWSADTHDFIVTAEPKMPPPPPRPKIAVDSTKRSATPMPFRTGTVVTDGLVAFEYPHIPTQRLPVAATDTVLAVDLRTAPRLRVAYIRSSRNDQIDSRIFELGVEIYAIDPIALGVADLSIYSTILIGPHAFADVEALAANAGVIRQFAEHGGTVVVLQGRDELLAPGVLPYPLAFGASNTVTAFDPQGAVHMITPHSSLLDWPNKIAAADFGDWVNMRARELPSTFDPRYRPVIELLDDNNRPNDAAILYVRLGKGVFIYTALAFDQQLARAQSAGSVRLLINLLSASQAPTAATRAR